MLINTLLGILVRTSQVALEASSTIVVGLFVAAIMRRMLGAEGTRRLFGGEGFYGLFRAWVIGSLLPVCSLGVIPVAREMRRSGVPVATIFAFVLAAPQLNPLSFLYGLTLSQPMVILSFVFGTMVIAILGGEMWKWFFETPGEREPKGQENMPSKGPKRLISIFWTAAQEMVGPVLPYFLLGIAFTGILSGSIPHGFLSLTMRHDQWHSPLVMALLGIPAYSGVLPGMMRVGLIFDHGNSVGAAYVLFELGVGMNLGLLAWMSVSFGYKRVLSWFFLVILLVLGFAYAIELPLYFSHEEAGHTHAFDEWSCPFVPGSNVDLLLVKNLILEKMEVLEPIAVAIIAVLGLTGLILPLFLKPEAVERWLTVPAATDSGSKSGWDRDVPGPVLGIVALAGLVLFSLVGLFIYYPNAKDAFVEIIRTRAEAMVAVNSGKKEEAIRQIRALDLLTRKVQVGVFLRDFHWNAETAKTTEDYREELELIRDALIADDLPEAKKIVAREGQSYRKFRDAFLSGAADLVGP